MQLEQNKYCIYDTIVADIFQAIRALSINSDIYLVNFDASKKSNLMVFEIAAFASLIYNKKIKVKCTFWQYMQLKRKIKDIKFYRVKNKELENNKVIDIKNTLKYTAEAMGITYAVFESIYKEYYER